MHDLGEAERGRAIELVLVGMTTCHSCVAAGEDFEGPSPDEVALLRAAKQAGFRFISCENRLVSVQQGGRGRRWEVLRVLEFDSDRKRMAVVLRGDEGLAVFAKGADSAISLTLAPEQQHLSAITARTHQMACAGLRSLWFAHKSLPPGTDPASLSEAEIESGL
mgnify:CR=1 FL=1